MKTTKSLTIGFATGFIIMIVAAGLLIIVSSAYAKRPLDVDCDLLAATNEAVDDFLDNEGITFHNLGDLRASVIPDDAVFAVAHDLILFFSGGAIDFASCSQPVATNAKYGLLPQLNEEVWD